MNAKPKTSQLSLLSSIVVASMVLTACGGGGGGDSTPAKQSQTISFIPPSTLGVGDTAVLKATASSKLSVAYQSTSTDVCTVTKNKVTAKAVGACKLTAKQVGNSNFKPAKDINISVAVVPATIVVTATDLQANKAGKVILSGKKVTNGITAKLGDKTVTVSKKGDYMAEIALTAAQLNLAGDVPLVIKNGKETLYNDVVKVATPTATGDAYTVKKTGITTCGNETDNSIACTDKTKLGDYYQTKQDGELKVGADMTYTKVAHQATRAGKKVMEYCVYDNVSGLTWEQKTDDDGLRDKDWKYTWYDSNSKTNGGGVGIEAPEADSCNKTLTKCNSEAYIAKLNEMKYCGFNDWRLPKDTELLAIRDFGKAEAPFVNPIFNFVKVKNMDGQNRGIYFTSSSSYAAQEAKGYQAVAKIDFSFNQQFYVASYKNQVPFYVAAVRGK